MYIIVVGGGKVGYYLSEELIHVGHEVLLIEKDARKCAAIAAELGSVVVHGDGCEASTMESVGMARADVVVAVTGDDEDNLVVCQMAKRKFNVPRTIARINNPRNEAIFKRLGIDATVSSTNAIMAQIEEQLPAAALSHLLTLHSVGVSIVEAKVPPDSPAIGVPIKEMDVPDDCIMPLIIRDGQAIIPYGKTALQAGDEILAITPIAERDVLGKLLMGS
jgi:trk system potassium uptake protein TrkA